jgi:surface antigen
MKLLSAGLLLTLFFVATQATAQNTMFLRDSPIAHLNEEDRKILRETIEQALESDDGTVIEWANPETGSEGRVKVLDTHTDATLQTECRSVRARNQARGRQADGVYRLCKAEDGTWRFAPPQNAMQNESTKGAND